MFVAHPGLSCFLLAYPFPRLVAHLGSNQGDPRVIPSRARHQMGKARRRVHWREVEAADSVTAVADEEVTAVADEQSPTAVADSEQDRSRGVGSAGAASTDYDSDSAVSSVPGDSVGESSGGETDESAIARRKARGDRRAPTQQSREQGQRAHAARNAYPEVGSMGIVFGNVGDRAFIARGAAEIDRRTRHDRQILRNPGQIVMLCEANHEVARALQNQVKPQSRTHRAQLMTKPPRSRGCRAATVTSTLS